MLYVNYITVQLKKIERNQAGVNGGASLGKGWVAVIDGKESPGLSPRIPPLHPQPNAMGNTDIHIVRESRTFLFLMISLSISCFGHSQSKMVGFQVVLAVKNQPANAREM